MHFRRRGFGEVASSLAMLMVTMTILGGLSIVSMQSIRSANTILSRGSQSQAQDAGLLFTLVSAKSNATGSYLWLYNYGWTTGRITHIYLNGGILDGWNSSCPILNPGTLCVVHFSQETGGNLTILIGSRSLVVAL